MSIVDPSWHHSSARPYSMIKAENTVLLLLAAGRSQRFGDADKLEQDYLGHPLAFHVVTALEGVPFRKRVAIVSGTRLDFAARGYEMIENKAPINGLSGRSEEHTSELQSLIRLSY